MPLTSQAWNLKSRGSPELLQGALESWGGGCVRFRREEAFCPQEGESAGQWVLNFDMG